MGSYGDIDYSAAVGDARTKDTGLRSQFPGAD